MIPKETKQNQVKICIQILGLDQRKSSNNKVKTGIDLGLRNFIKHMEGTIVPLSKNKEWHFKGGYFTNHPNGRRKEQPNQIFK